MIRALFRMMLILVLLVAAAVFYFGWWKGTGASPAAERRDAVEEDGTRRKPSGVDTDRVREIGSELGERTAAAAEQARRALEDGGLTAKIKSKMALDDTIAAGDIDVDTTNGVVTVSGVVRTQGQRQRALQLARETAGVTRVVDRLTVQR